VRVKQPGTLTQHVLRELLDDVVIVREAELRETLVRLALEEHVIAEGAGALALAAGRRVAGRRKCAVVSGGNVDAGVLASLLCDVRPRPPRKPRRRVQEPPAVAAFAQPVLDEAAAKAGTQARLRPAAPRVAAPGAAAVAAAVAGFAPPAPIPACTPTEDCLT
jgi:threonine dehydratase